MKTISRTNGKFLEALINGENLFDLISMEPYSAKARIVALEGINCCGKTTQIKLLKQNLKKNGVNVFTVPTYETACWDIISKIGKGTFLIHEPISDSVLWATYFIDQIHDCMSLLETADVVIFDVILKCTA